MTWSTVISVYRPELVLVVAACALFLLGISSRAAVRRLVPFLAIGALIVVVLIQLVRVGVASGAVGSMAQFIKLLAAGVGAMFVLLSWPTDRDAAGNSALRFGTDAAGEFFALLLLSITGILLVAGADDLILLFLGLELASIPTYIMVSISRPLPAAQEAGVKYFFLGAMAAAVMLFGFSYLYGTTGLISLAELTEHFAKAPGALTSWQMLAVVMLIGGFAFKMAAVPLHFYAGDVYEGAATPVTALLSFVPKTSGFIALIKILHATSGGTWMAPPEISKLLWILAVLSMSVGNMLGLMQYNVKRVLAYSSIAHTGYMLVGLTALVDGRSPVALQGILFYLTAYGVMNVAAFGVLMLLPARQSRTATSAETFEDLAGVGRKHPMLGLVMAVACFSLTGLPLTVGFFGKVYLIAPALDAGDFWLAVLMMINAAIAAGYYLKIVAVMFLRTDADETQAPAAPLAGRAPILLAVALSTAGTLLLGVVFPATSRLREQTLHAAQVDSRPIAVQVSAQK